MSGSEEMIDSGYGRMVPAIPCRICTKPMPSCRYINVCDTCRSDPPIWDFSTRISYSKCRVCMTFDGADLCTECGGCNFCHAHAIIGARQADGTYKSNEVCSSHLK